MAKSPSKQPVSRSKPAVKSVRNKFEARFAEAHPALEYETMKLSYVLNCSYTPDFIDHASKTIYETKGRFEPADRRKILAVKKQHPDWTIILVFQNPNRPILKGSKTTYAMWCDKNDVKWQSFK